MSLDELLTECDSFAVSYCVTVLWRGSGKLRDREAMRSWPSARPKVLLIGAMTILPAVAVAQFDCSRIDPGNCPSLFVEECKEREFQLKHTEACFDALVGGRKDAEFCTDPQIEAACRQAAQCDFLDDPVRQHFCVAGQSNCTTSIPVLLGEYNDVLQGLDASLARYSDLTNLNLDEATSIDILCNYQIEQLNSLRKQAESELSDLQSSEESIDQIDQCASTMQSFIDSGAPPDLPAELWDQIARRLTDGMSQIQRKQGEIQSNIDALHAAPKKLQSLQIAYRLTCPEQSQ